MQLTESHYAVEARLSRSQHPLPTTLPCSRPSCTGPCTRPPAHRPPTGTPPCCRSNLFEWAVTVLGPPDTLYEGGFFNAVLKFPREYPQLPPDMRFTSEMW